MPAIVEEKIQESTYIGQLSDRINANATLIENNTTQIADLELDSEGFSSSVTEINKQINKT